MLPVQELCDDGGHVKLGGVAYMGGVHTSQGSAIGSSCVRFTSVKARWMGTASAAATVHLRAHPLMTPLCSIHHIANGEHHGANDCGDNAVQTGAIYTWCCFVLQFIAIHNHL